MRGLSGWVGGGGSFSENAVCKLMCNPRRTKLAVSRLCSLSLAPLPPPNPPVSHISRDQHAAGFSRPSHAAQSTRLKSGHRRSYGTCMIATPVTRLLLAVLAAASYLLLRLLLLRHR